MLRCEDKSVSMLYPKQARQDAELLFELTSSLCCREKASGIVSINTKCLAYLFALGKLLFCWSP